MCCLPKASATITSHDNIRADSAVWGKQALFVIILKCSYCCPHFLCKFSNSHKIFWYSFLFIHVPFLLLIL